MISRFVRHVVSIAALTCTGAMIFGCRQACDPADSKAMCTAVKECFEEHPVSTCREYESIALQMSKPNPKLKELYQGTAQGLKY
jgi:hypothetical protein